MSSAPILLLPPPERLSHAAATSHLEPVAPAKVNILLVDDRPEKLLALEAVLSSLGQNLVIARSGKEALRLLLRHDFAVILLDISMPVMDGFETASLIRQRPNCEHTPIIFVTSHNDSENHVARGYSIGAVDYILSPIVPEVLKTKVSVFVELYKKTEEVRRQAELLRQIEEQEHKRRLSDAVDRLEAETRRNRFFTLAVDLLAIADFEGSMLQLNPAWEDTLGFATEELKRRPLLEFVDPEYRPAMQRELQRLQTRDATTAYIETRCAHKNGSFRWLGWTIAPFVSERLFYIFARDITGRKSSEEKIHSLNRELQTRVSELVEINEELEAFNYSISHDLRAPLRSMQGFARALLEDESPRLSADGKEYAERIVNSGGHMDRLLQDLLNYSCLARSEFEMAAVNLEVVVKEVLTQNQKELADRNAQIDVQTPLASVLAHPATLNQILANLVSNAAKFVEPSRRPRVRVRAESFPGFIRLWVEDNGLGIDPAHHKKIFGLFERLHTASTYPGTGIGLAIVRKGAERMGGRAGLESALGEGSRFWIELPAAG